MEKVGVFNTIFRKKPDHGDLLFSLACWIQQCISCNICKYKISYKNTIEIVFKRINMTRPLSDTCPLFITKVLLYPRSRVFVCSSQGAPFYWFNRYACLKLDVSASCQFDRSLYIITFMVIACIQRGISVFCILSQSENFTPL